MHFPTEYNQMTDQWPIWASIALDHLLERGFDKTPEEVARVAALIADAMDKEYCNRFEEAE